jgi:hypothetical protein
LIIIEFVITGEEKTNNYLRAKFKNLVKNKKEEVVWTIQKDNSFINLIYECKVQYNSKLHSPKINLQKKEYSFIKGNTISDEDINTTTARTGSEYDKNQKLSLHTKNYSSEKKSPSSMVHSSKEIPKLSISYLPKGKNFSDIGNSSGVNDSHDKNFDSQDSINEDCISDYQLLENNYIYNETNNIYSKDYISSLNKSEYDYDTFCQCIIISGLKQNKLNVINQSENLPAVCGHKDCSINSSFSPSILYHYKNKNKKYQIQISDLIAELIFPFGIKICFCEYQYPKCEEPIMNIIHNEVGDKFYMVSFFYYKKMNLKKFDERFKNTNLGKNICKIYKRSITTDIPIYVPESISLISRFPFIDQMGQCLKDLISITDNTKFNMFVNHIINQVPVPYKNQKIKFYTPIRVNPIKLVNPFILNSVNYKPDNIFDYFSVDNIITIFYLSLLEQQLLFIDNDHSLLCSISYLFMNLTYPITWIDTYIPILTLTSISFLQSIVPFIMGSSEYLVNYAINNSYIGEQYSPRVTYIHITNNIVSSDIYSLLNKKKGMNRKNILKNLELPQIPESLEKLLTKRLNGLKNLFNNNKNIDYIKEIKKVFCDIMINLLGQFKQFFFIIDDNPIFNKESFIECQKNEEKLFYKEFIETQAFMQFLVIEKEEMKKRKNCVQKAEIIPKYGRTFDNFYADKTYFYLRRIQINKENRINSTNKNGTDKKNKNNYGNILDISNFDNDEDYSGIEALKMLNIVSKQNRNDNNLKILLMPYFIEELKNNKMDTEQKKDYIQNKLNEILGLDNEIEKILNVHNLPYYILPSYKRYNFDTIIDDNYQKYFIGSIYSSNLLSFEHKNQDNDIDDMYENGNNLSENFNIFTKNDEKNTKKNNNYIKMDEWFQGICFPNKKSELIDSNQIISLLSNKNYRTYLIKLIFQYNLTSDEFYKYIKEESMEKLTIVIFHILIKINRDEFILGKLITLTLFNYYSYDKKARKNYFLIHKLKTLYNDGNLSCSVWYTYEFWKAWLKDDFKSKENDIYNYFDDEEENLGQKMQYFFISRISKIMKGLGIQSSLIDEVVFQNLAIKYLNQNQIEDLRREIPSK